MERSVMMDVVTPSITKDHPSQVRRSGLSATSQIHFYKDENLQCPAAHFSLSSQVALEIYRKQCYLPFLHLSSIIKLRVSLYALSWPLSEKE